MARDPSWGLTDRAAGALVGLAAGDALGAGYEFATPPRGDAEMIGGGLGGFEPGEWTDDTQMAICVAEVTARGSLDLEAIGQRFLDWYRSDPADVGVQTSTILSAANGPGDLQSIAVDHFRQNPGSAAGNGSLMRTAPVALARLGDDDAIAEAAMAVSTLTHGDPLAGEACVLWCIAIDRAVREARLDGIDDGLEALPAGRRAFWRARIDEARGRPPAAFTPNGFVVTALQAALAAITQTPVPGAGSACLHLREALHAAVRIGDDTDTVAAIAGALLGARWGVTAVPFAWRRRLHGWPGYRVRHLVGLAVLTARHGQPDSAGWPSTEDLGPQYAGSDPHPPRAGRLPGDPDVVVGNVAALAAQSDVDVVVSLCRMGTAQVPADVEHHEVLLVDEPAGNDNLEFVLADTAAAIATLRDEGRRVFLHCVGGRSRTPIVAAAYLNRRFGLSPEEALRQVSTVLPYSPHNETFREALDALTGRDRGEEGTVRAER